MSMKSTAKADALAPDEATDDTNVLQRIFTLIGVTFIDLPICFWVQ